MSKTPEERAQQLANDMLDRAMVPIISTDCRALIASAIRKAERETVRRVVDAISSPHDHVGAIALMRLVEHAPDLVSHED
jgi:hypothetical protein